MATESKTGRPSDYLPEVAADICSLLADGESLRKVCSPASHCCAPATTSFSTLRKRPVVALRDS